jgi:2-polyprenyl-3-methyl-5-hydroxy-6-metoxy-1,4-benzoquinol methylase
VSAELRYDFPIEYRNTKSVYYRVMDWCKPGWRVLDIGCDTGNLGLAIKSRGASVDGIEICPEAANMAAGKLDAVFTGNIADPAVAAQVTGPYDAIIFADVLEHIAQPADTLELVKKWLRPGGVVIASLPNVANFRVRFGLLFGRFEYTEIGILDKTHLRFFTKKTAKELFAGSGFEVLDTRPAATHMPSALLYSWPGLFATRFVVMARPK